ncbi:allantoin permease [Armillaria borealis]|uniref:Allantoin permease n=1 Tax=Armillaria borealis TaxID=47425 RepID=A0AA39MV89_9AGAR|nr:allantoin permease [Armillaria borealis]
MHFRTWSSFNRYIKTDAGRNLPGNGHIWENEGWCGPLPLFCSRGLIKRKRPSPLPRRASDWGTGSFFAFWFSESMNTSTWAVASSMITLGMTWWHAILVVFSANMLSSVILIPKWIRVEWMAYRVSRTRTDVGSCGLVYSVPLGDILSPYVCGVYGRRGTPMDNHIPESIGITSRDLAGFGIFWIISVGFLAIPPYKTRWLFHCQEFPITSRQGLGLLIWALKKNHGFTGMSFGATQSSGSTLAWAVHCTLWATCGIMVTAAMNRQWDTAYWNPYDLLNAMLDHDMSSPVRAGCFFASAAFILATLGTSIANNTIPFGADITALLPRYLTNVRGQLLCGLIGFLIFPWRILSSAPGFLTFLNGYSIFMGPVVGIMIIDYFLVRKGNLQLAGLFTGSRDGPYYYTWGINWRAIVAFIAGTGIPFPGFVQSFGSVAIGEVAEEMFDFGWLASFGIGAIIYWVLCRVFPVQNVDRCLALEAELERIEREEVERRIKEEYPDGVPYIY